jgi:hypothetical protein
MRNFLLFFSLTLLLVACELFPEAEPENTLPPITQEGANTFGCKVNGEVWLPYKDGGLFSGSALKWELGQNSFEVDPINDKSLFSQIIVSIRSEQSIVEGKTYYFHRGEPLRFSPDSTTIYTSWGGGMTSNYCDFGFPRHGISYSEGWVRITKYDPLAHESNIGVVAGEFEFTTYPNEDIQFEECDTLTQPIHVTEGRFDIKTLKR